MMRLKGLNGMVAMRRTALLLALPVLVVLHSAAQVTTTALLDTIQHTAFGYFWNEANPANGLIRDRSQSGSPCSIASVGFGLSAICIGVDHGWVSRPAARDRVLTTLKTFWYGPQGDGDGFIGKWGLFYHFLDMTTATRTWNCELSTIDTALLLAGIVDAWQFFDGSDSTETSIRALADSIYRRMNWDLMRNYYPGILMGYFPGKGFSDPNGNPYGQWIGYNEASIMYILAMGSPTYPVDFSGWQTWTSGYLWANYYGYQYVAFAPLFGHQYSQCWLDLRNIADDYMRGMGITYFENSRRATLAQRAYAIANPGRHTGYSDSLWGLTASDTPTGYAARGAPPAQDDDGTITPTAPVSSIAFAPNAVLPVIRNMWNTYRASLWTQYGFRDAFNLDKNWWDTDIIGIDQGPMIIMIENYRTQAVWNRFMKNPYVQRGLQVAGFLPVTGVREEEIQPQGFVLQQNYPNPFNPSTAIGYRVSGLSAKGGSASGGGFVSLKVYDLLGREVAALVDEVKKPGTYAVQWDAQGYASGVYLYRLQAGDFIQTKKMLLLR